MLATIKAQDYAFLCRFASNEPTRFYLQGSYCDSAGYRVATDGHRLGALRCLDGEETVAACIIPASPELLRLAKAKPSANYTRWIVQYADRVEVIERREGQPDEAIATLPLKPVDGTFPDWRRVVADFKTQGTSGARRATFNGDYLASFTAYGAKGNALAITVVSCDPDSPAAVLNADPRFFGIVMPIRDKRDHNAAVEEFRAALLPAEKLAA